MLDYKITVSVTFAGREHAVDIPFTVHHIIKQEQLIDLEYSRDINEAIKECYGNAWEVKGQISVTEVVWFELVWDGIDAPCFYQIADVSGWFEGGQRQFRLVLKNYRKNIDFKLFFPPLFDLAEERAQSSCRELKACFEKHRVFVRSPQSFFGWDWAGKMFPFGIRQLPVLKEYHPVRLLGMGILNTSSILRCALESDHKTKVKLIVNALCSLDEEVSGSFALSVGMNLLDVDIAELHVPGWQPGKEGRGREFELSIAENDKRSPLGNRILFRREIKFDYLTCKLSCNNREIRWGANFVEPYFPDNESDVSVRELMEIFSLAGGQLLRIWGGGRYPTEDLLTACDELGIVVWSDMPFACANYPVEDFKEEYAAELEEFLLRSLHHPCLAIVCGGNENKWLFGKTMSEEEWGFFSLRAAEITKELNPGMFYIPNSPYGEPEANSPQMGSIHQWGFWSGMKSISEVIADSPFFVAEYGYQSFPSQALLSREGISESEALISMQFQEKGNEIASHYLHKHFEVVPKERALSTRFLQAQSLSLLTRCWAFNEEFNGALVWQLNDVAPAISWSLVDSHGIAKPALSALHQLWKGVFIAVKLGESTDFRFIRSCGEVTWELTTIAGRKKSVHRAVSIKPYGEISFPLSSIEVDFIRCEAECEGVAAIFEWWVNGRHKGAMVEYQVKERNGQRVIEISSKSDEPCCCIIECETPLVFPARNPVTLLKGETSCIALMSCGNVSASQITDSVSVRVLGRVEAELKVENRET